MARCETSLAEVSRAHLASADESYFEHMRVAGAIGTLMVMAGAACLVHAVVPGLCTDRASRAIRRLDALIEDRRLRDQLVREDESGGILLLLLLCVLTGLLPWLAGAQPPAAAPLSMLSLAVALAALLPSRESV